MVALMEKSRYHKHLQDLSWSYHEYLTKWSLESHLDRNTDKAVMFSLCYCYKCKYRCKFSFLSLVKKIEEHVIWGENNNDLLLQICRSEPDKSTCLIKFPELVFKLPPCFRQSVSLHKSHTCNRNCLSDVRQGHASSKPTSVKIEGKECWTFKMSDGHEQLNLSAHSLLCVCHRKTTDVVTHWQILRYVCVYRTKETNKLLSPKKYPIPMTGEPSSWSARIFFPTMLRALPVYSLSSQVYQ